MYKYVNISIYVKKNGRYYAFSSNCYKFVIDNINNNI